MAEKTTKSDAPAASDDAPAGAEAPKAKKGDFIAGMDYYLGGVRYKKGSVIPADVVAEHGPTKSL